MNPKRWLKEHPPPTAEERGIEDPVLEKVGELDRKVGVIEGKTAVRETQERADLEVELAQERVRRSTEERNVLRKFSPFRSHWPELRDFDLQVADLERRQGEVSAELQRLRDRELAAPAAHAEALAAWQLDGEQGPRPESELSAIRTQIERLQQDSEALVVATGRILDRKVAHIERHRSKLVKEADEQTEQAHHRYLAAIEAILAAREELSATRRLAVWVRLYPHESAQVEPPGGLVGGHAATHKQIGLQRAYHLEELVGLLMADADWLKQARTREQEAALRGVDPRQLDIGGTVWTDDPEEKRKRGERMAQWAASR